MTYYSFLLLIFILLTKQKLFQEARKKIKALHSEKGQKKLENNLRSTLAQELQELSIIFRKYQKDFLNSKTKFFLFFHQTNN